MKTFLVLARVQLLALLASLRVGGSRKRASSGWLTLALMAGLCLYISGFYSFTLGSQLAQTGALDLLLVLMPAMAVICGLAFTVFAAQGVVFSGRDADLLLSMPVSAFTVLLAKLTALYGENLLVCVFLVLPAGAAHLWYGGSAWVLLRLVLGVPFLALAPTMLALAGGFLLSWAGARFANRRGVSLLLYTLLLAAVMALAVQVNMAVSALAMGPMGGTISVPVWAVPFRLFQLGVCGDWETLVMFCLLALVPALLAVKLFSGSYQRVLTGLHTHRKNPAYRLTRLNASSRRRALLRKEAVRYFGTPIYLFNTGIGLILLVVLGIAAAVMGAGFREQLAGQYPLPVLAAAAVAFLLSTVAVTGSSISLEGGNLWILKEAPISAGELLDTKALFQVLLASPCLLLAVAGMAWGLRMGVAETAVILLFELAFSCFTALLGLVVNLCYPKLDAISDMAVVKQSLAAMLSTFGGMVLAVACATLIWLGSRSLGVLASLALCTLALLLGGALLRWWIHVRGVSRFSEL